MIQSVRGSDPLAPSPSSVFSRVIVVNEVSLECSHANQSETKEDMNEGMKRLDLLRV